MRFEALIDPWSVVVVLGGTLATTLLRTGRAEWLATVQVLGQLLQPRFSYARARASVAHQVEEIRHVGVMRAKPKPSSDPEIEEATGALIRRRSIAALIEAHERHKRGRQRRRRRALHLLGQAGELAPVFGLAGTLIALSQLSADGIERGDLMATVGMAVLTTLYGLLTAHLLVFPLARLIERRGEEEEAGRQKLIDWLAEQLADAMPSQLPRARDLAA